MTKPTTTLPPWRSADDADRSSSGTRERLPRAPNGSCGRASDRADLRSKEISPATVPFVGEPRAREVITRERIWNLESAVTGVLAAMIAKRLIRAAYAVIRKQEPRSVFDPDSDHFSWPNFVVWAVAGGVGLGIAKLVGNRVATVAWELATGTRPPKVGEAEAST
jgi:hypothetical protein